MKFKPIRAAVVCLSACGVAHSQSNQNSAPPPAGSTSNPPPSLAEQMQQNGGSLLRATLTTAAAPAQSQLQNVSFFAVPAPEPRTLSKHDLVTIVIRELSEQSSEGTTDLKKDAEFKAALEEWIKFNGLDLSGGGVSPPVPRIKLTGSRRMKGDATVDREDSLIMRVTAEVLDVKPNGTLVLQARQRIQTDEEVQTLVLTGICRAEDVTPDNTILSSQMFDKKITKTHSGAVRDTTKRGWLVKLLDALSPF